MVFPFFHIFILSYTHISFIQVFDIRAWINVHATVSRHAIYRQRCKLTE